MAKTTANTTTKSATQQAELDRLRKLKSQAAPEVADELVDDAADAAKTNHWKALLSEMYANAGIPVPTWKRSLASFIASFAVGFGIGMVADIVITAIATAIFTATSSMFLAYMVIIVGWMLTLYAAMKAGQKVGMYIVMGDIDRDVSRAWGWVKGKLGSKPAPQLA